VRGHREVEQAGHGETHARNVLDTMMNGTGRLLARYGMWPEPFHKKNNSQGLFFYFQALTGWHLAIRIKASPLERIDTMTTINFVGDVHAKYSAFAKILDQSVYPVVQVGDFGFGFEPVPESIDNHSTNWHFIRGNHDSPQLAKNNHHFIGDYVLFNGLFVVSGAHSIDYHSRIQGVSWWPDEELSYYDGLKALDIYTQLKPRIVVSHDCPYVIQKHLWSRSDVKSVTAQLLTEMFAVHQPDLWLFGHYHQSMMILEGHTLFRCLGELEVQAVEYTP
jgi:hypothetical protein